MPSMNRTTNAALIATILANKTLGYFGSFTSMVSNVARDFENTPATKGKTIEVAKRGTLTANAKATNTPVTVQNPTATKVSINLDQHYEVTFSIEDATEAVQKEGVLEGYAEDAALVLIDQVEAKLAGLYASLTATVIPFDATSAATIDASMRAVRKHFTDVRVPKREKKFAYVGSEIYDALLSVDKYVNRQTNGGDQNGNQVVETGVLRNIYGIDVFESQSAITTGTTPTAVEHGIVYARDAFMLATRPLPMAPAGAGVFQRVLQNDAGLGLRISVSWDKDNLAMQVTVDILFGVGVNDQRRAVGLELTY